jgi:hypothetical protein
VTAANDQVAVFVNGLSLPLDAIPDENLTIILETICSAWQSLITNGSEILTSGDEKNVTALLEASLIHLCKTDPLFKGLVSIVARGVESRNFDSTKIELRPDLSIYLTDPKRPFPLILECKLIDHPNGKDVSLYCSKGIARFVNGDYAWTNREAIMLAYVRDGSTVQQCLASHLLKSAKSKPDPFQTTSHPVARPEVHPAVHQSSHDRNFTYLSVVDGTEPGVIGLFHLWL